MGGYDGNARPERLDPRDDSRLVNRIGIGVEQTDGDGFDALTLKIRHDGSQIVQFDGGENFAAIGQSLPDFTPQIAGHEGRRFLKVEIIEIRTRSPTDLKDIAKSGCGDEPGFGALPLCQGIDDDRRAMGEKSDIGRRHTGLGDRVQNSPLEVWGRSVCFTHAHHAAVRIEIDEIGECSPDIRGDPHVRQNSHCA